MFFLHSVTSQFPTPLMSLFVYHLCNSTTVLWFCVVWNLLIKSIIHTYTHAKLSIKHLPLWFWTLPPLLTGGGRGWVWPAPNTSYDSSLCSKQLTRHCDTSFYVVFVSLSTRFKRKYIGTVLHHCVTKNLHIIKKARTWHQIEQ